MHGIIISSMNRLTPLDTTAKLASLAHGSSFCGSASSLMQLVLDYRQQTQLGVSMLGKFPWVLMTNYIKHVSRTQNYINKHFKLFVYFQLQFSSSS